ncbi:MAG: DUF521 domain-containing protein [Desulfamplus sp.]|nr:DUF521 domain-containing protein [Desulfamplus sp.]
MKLTDNDKKILNGDNGLAPQKAMELIVRYGEIVGAESLCSVTWADLFCGCHSYLGVANSIDFDEVFSKMALCTNEKATLEKMANGCICYSGVEPDCTEIPEKMFMSDDKKALNLSFLSRFVDANVILSGNCIPYLTGFVPIMGDHFVSCESSAVLFMNSMWGAMGNGDGIEASFCAAVCGRTPLAGMHLKEKRIGTIEVRITTNPKTLHDWDNLGYALGRKLPPHSIPVFTGNYEKPNSIILKTFFASLACSSGTEMCHIVGITPEAPSYEEAFKKSKLIDGKCCGNRKVDSITLSIEEIEKAKLSLTSKDSSSCRTKHIDYITIGCPHLHIEELREVARFLDGKKIHSGTHVDIWTTGPMKYMAERCGYAKVIENAGANILTGGCPSNRGYPNGTKKVAFDSSKQRQDAPINLGNDNIFFGSRQSCLESAIKGYWVE